MKRMKKRYYLPLFLLVLSIMTSMADNTQEKNLNSGRWSIVGNSGLNRFDGDLEPDYDYTGILKSPSADFTLEYNFNPVFSWGWNVGGLILNQEDIDEVFTTGGVYTSTFLSMDLLSILNGKKSKKWSLTGFAGVGLSGLIMPKYLTTRQVAIPNPANGVIFPPAFFIFPVGGSLEYNLSKKYSLGINGKFVYTNTDQMESIERHNYLDVWQNVSISLRYKFVTNDNKHFRDEVFSSKETPSLSIYNQIQQDVNNLNIRLDGVDSKLNNLGERLVAVEGILSNDGPDTDKDGVPDVRDLEPNTTPGTAVDFWGRSLNVKTVKAVDQLSVYFDFDSIELDKTAQITLISVADRMLKDASMMLEIRGYADNLGTSTYNQRLSQRRAERVKQELEKVYGIPQNRIVANGKGKIPNPPVKTLMNRRCDFFFSK
jgi:outer membrane protein OmpA-like peptidoglycan-associated protein